MVSALRVRLYIRMGIALVALGLLVSCSSRSAILIAPEGTAQPAPTVAAFFLERPTVASVLETPNRPTAAPAHAARRPSDSLSEIVVYDDILSPSWSLAQSEDVEYDTRSREFVDQGRYALSATTRNGLGTLYFSVERDSEDVFRRDKVLGLRFRLSGGRDPIANDQILVTVVGSNGQPYWIPNDTSVRLEGRVTDGSPLFSQTRLYYLDIHHVIPSGEWTDVYVWLDDLIYDPEYRYITGIVIKTDNLDRFYLDDIALIEGP